eukprot:707957-Rhodomonas_salina.3
MVHMVPSLWFPPFDSTLLHTWDEAIPRRKEKQTRAGKDPLRKSEFMAPGGGTADVSAGHRMGKAPGESCPGSYPNM